MRISFKPEIDPVHGHPKFDLEKEFYIPICDQLSVATQGILDYIMQHDAVKNEIVECINAVFTDPGTYMWLDLEMRDDAVDPLQINLYIECGSNAKFTLSFTDLIKGFLWTRTIDDDDETVATQRLITALEETIQMVKDGWKEEYNNL